MPLPLRVSDLPRGVQNKIIAGTVAEEIAEFEHRQGIRPKPASCYAPIRFREAELGRQERARAALAREALYEASTSSRRRRPLGGGHLSGHGAETMNMSGATQRPGTAPGKLGSRPHTPMSHLEDILAPHPENRRQLTTPSRGGRSFDLALRRNQEFDNIDPKVGAFNRACIEKRLRETVAHRVETDRTYVDTVRRRRDAQRERFNTLAYSRYVAAVRRQEPHAVTRYRSARSSGSNSGLTRSDVSWRTFRGFSQMSTTDGPMV